MSAILAFDFGTKRIGVAVGQTITRSASPLAQLAAKDGEPNWQQVSDLLKQWRPRVIVVGVPLNMDGTEQNTTEFARHFCQQLRERFGLTVHEVDERLTTQAVREQVFAEGGYQALQKADIDSLSAKLILEQWLREQPYDD